MTKPNILFVFSDQQRASTLGCMHDEPVQTPHLDRLAAEGILFTNAIANTPVCTPSRATLLTGRHALTNRTFANDLRLPEEEQSIADLLKAQGYRTGYVGKWHLDGISRHIFTPPGRRRHGFDDYWAAYNCNHRYLDGKYYLNDSPELQHYDGYDADGQTEQAIGFLEQFRNEPFCLFVSWGPPHDPYDQVPQPFLDQYPIDPITLRPNFQGGDPQALAGYYAHVTALDHNMGRLMAALDRLNLSENTIVVYTSDHGDMLWSQGHTMKQQPWEESIHVPLIIRWPKELPAGEVRDTLISIVDYAPTLLGLAGVTIPTAMNGVDLSATILGESTFEQTCVFIAEYVSWDQARAYQPWRGVRTKRHTYARWRQGGSILYDNQVDPYQLQNLVHEADHDLLQTQLEQELQRWLTKLHDGFLSGDAHLRKAGRWEEWQIRQEHFYGFRTTNF